MKFLIYCEDKKAMVYFKYLIEETFTCRVDLADKKENFIQNLSSSVGYDWMFFASNEPFSSEQIGIIEQAAGRIPGVFIRSHKEEVLKISLPSVAYSELPDTQKLLKTIALAKGIEYNPDEVASGFIPVSMDYLAKIFQTRCDFFIKLSEVKFLKIIKSGTEIHGVDLQKYTKNDVAQLYVRSDDFDDFLESVEYSERDYSKLSTEEAKAVIVSDLTFAHDTFYKLSSNFGLNTKALTYANNSVQTLYKFIETENNLQLAWQALIKKKNFITEHSLMVGYLANAVLSHTDYQNENNSLRLSLASVLHDIELKNEKFYQLEIYDNDESYSLKEMNAFKAHVHAGTEMLSKFKAIPSDLDKLLLTHHEKYDGSGFPRGLTGPKLPLLAAIFIVCHEFVVHMMDHQFSKDEITSFINEKKLEYTEGYFKDVILTLEKIR